MDTRRIAVGTGRASICRSSSIACRPRDVTVEPYPEFLEREANDSYWPAAEDGSRPAKYMITLFRFAETTRSNTEITAFHEAYPGHHLQLASRANGRQRI